MVKQVPYWRITRHRSISPDPRMWDLVHGKFLTDAAVLDFHIVFAFLLRANAVTEQIPALCMLCEESTQFRWILENKQQFFAFKVMVKILMMSNNFTSWATIITKMFLLFFHIIWEMLWRISKCIIIWIHFIRLVFDSYFTCESQYTLFSSIENLSLNICSACNTNIQICKIWTACTYMRADCYEITKISSVISKKQFVFLNI